MLGLGWTEMLVVGVMALIVIGPKDLPKVMQQVGKYVGQIRRMGNEFQREINRSTGLDEVRNLRKSISEPLRKSSEEIRREFNTLSASGKEEPSGKLKPSEPGKESVADEIRTAAGMSPKAPVKADASEVDPATLAASENAQTTDAEPAAKRSAPVKAAPRKRAAAKAPAQTRKTSRSKTATDASDAEPAVTATETSTAKPAKATARKATPSKTSATKSGTAKAGAKPASAKPAPTRAGGKAGAKTSTTAKPKSGSKSRAAGQADAAAKNDTPAVSSTGSSDDAGGRGESR